MQVLFLQFWGFDFLKNSITNACCESREVKLFRSFCYFFVSCAFQSHITQSFSNIKINSGMKTDYTQKLFVENLVIKGSFLNNFFNYNFIVLKICRIDTISKNKKKNFAINYNQFLISV